MYIYIQANLQLSSNHKVKDAFKASFQIEVHLRFIQLCMKKRKAAMNQRDHRYPVQ